MKTAVLWSLLLSFALVLLSIAPITRLHDNVQPTKCKVWSQGYGIDTQFRFGKSIDAHGFSCSASCDVLATARNNFGPFYYERRVEGWAPADMSDMNEPPNPQPHNMWRGDPFSELR